MKKGQIIKMYFRCAGRVSEEEREVFRFNKDTITTTDTIHPDDESKEANEKFDRKTGKCLNDNTMFGASRRIDPQ